MPPFELYLQYALSFLSYKLNTISLLLIVCMYNDRFTMKVLFNYVVFYYVYFPLIIIYAVASIYFFPLLPCFKSFRFPSSFTFTFPGTCSVAYWSFREEFFSCMNLPLLYMFYYIDLYFIIKLYGGIQYIPGIDFS